ncbi:hypothetical protein NDU88_010983 [Pleurodeles waltl]|uniref:Uncharacterized protein n=1 Tax=Pleurodeles waltl TaxID=8319 RepID=A0AAV7S3F7_PLEWA|nr:hypothetical protein NDU88_010983 [Pleurodeles waltl]
MRRGSGPTSAPGRWLGDTEETVAAGHGGDDRALDTVSCRCLFAIRGFNAEDTVCMTAALGWGDIGGPMCRRATLSNNISLLYPYRSALHGGERLKKARVG